MKNILFLILLGAPATDEPSQRLDALEKAVAQLQATKSQVTGILGVGIIGTASLIFSLWAGTRKKIIQAIEKKWHAERDDIYAMIEKAKIDREVMEKTTIIALDPGNDHQEYKFLRKLGFLEVRRQTWSALETLAEPECDLILVTNPNLEQVDGLLRRFPEPTFVVYTKDHLKVSDPDRVVFANSLITLYSRTVEAGRYHRLHQQ